MAKQIREIMTTNPVVMKSTDTVVEAACLMRDRNIGAVLVYKNDALCGIVTDRDLAVRVLPEGSHPAGVSLQSICSQDVTKLSPTDTTESAVKLMREKAVRRLPVIENGKAVGIVSLGDLAIHVDRASALGQISAAPANR